MCENIQYWMRLYVARVIKGGLIAVVASFLLFECSGDSSKMDNKMDNPDNPGELPDEPVIGKVIISKSTLAFDDTAGSTGGKYMISLSQDPEAGKTVKVTLVNSNIENFAISSPSVMTSTNSPFVVTFTESTGKAAQLITVKRINDADDVDDEILADITGLITHTIVEDGNSDPNITTFQDGSTVTVTVTSTSPKVIISKNMLFLNDLDDFDFDDRGGSTGISYDISLSQAPAREKIVQITLTILTPEDVNNGDLAISSDGATFLDTTTVTFTEEATRETTKTITVKRKNDATNVISADMTGMITHTIASVEDNENSDPKIITFQGGNGSKTGIINVTVRSTVPKVTISENTLAFNDADAVDDSNSYTISLSQDPVPTSTSTGEVEITLTSSNDKLNTSPDSVTFTEKGFKKIIVRSDSIREESITGMITHTIVVPSDDPTTFEGSSTVNVTVRKTNTLVDFDKDGLIDIYTAEMLNNMRYDLAGASYKTSADDIGKSDGCPGGCKGYELMNDIDLFNFLNTGGNEDGSANGKIDTIEVTIAGIMHDVINTDEGKDKSWIPIGHNDSNIAYANTRFSGIFDGNNHTIANLWVNFSSSEASSLNLRCHPQASGCASGSAGLFGATEDTVEIRNVGITSGLVYSSSAPSGGLVGSIVSGGSLTIVNSYFSGSCGVSSSSSASGGLIGRVDGTVTIMNSHFSGSGGISSSSSSSSASGGLVGRSRSGPSSLTIVNSHFSSSGGISSSSSSSSSASGGLVGRSIGSLTIMNSYFSGSGGISSSGSSSSTTFLGGLIGWFDNSTENASLSIRDNNNYWDTTPVHSKNGVDQSEKGYRGDNILSGDYGLNNGQLKYSSGNEFPSGLPHSETDNTKAWDLGTNTQLPAVKLCVPTGTNWKTCASYIDLIAGQR